MTRRYETRCWFCNNTDLEPDERGIRCRSCGATYNVIPKPGSKPITLKRDPILSPYGTRTIKTPSPSGRVQQRATKARGEV